MTRKFSIRWRGIWPLERRAIVIPTVSLDINLILQGVLVLVIGAGARALVGRLSSIRDHLATLNGRMDRMETWRIEHAKVEGERISDRIKAGEDCRTNIRREFDAVWRQLGERRDET